MSRFTGPQHKGAEREMRKRRREEAEERQANVRPERTRRYRLEVEPVLAALDRA